LPKNGQPAKDKRTLNIADESGLSIIITLWGNNSNAHEYREGDIFAVRGARVSDYGGRSLNAGHEHSQVYINIDHKRTRELKQWNKQRDPNNINSVSSNSISTGPNA